MEHQKTGTILAKAYQEIKNDLAKFIEHKNGKDSKVVFTINLINSLERTNIT
jgi:hypothetical protein